MSQVSNSWRDLPPHKNPQNHTQKCSDSPNWHEAHPGRPVSFRSPSPQLRKSPDSPSNLRKNFIHTPEPPATPSKYSSEFQPGRELNSLIQHTADALRSIVQVVEKLIWQVNAEHQLAQKPQRIAWNSHEDVRGNAVCPQPPAFPSERGVSAAGLPAASDLLA